MTQKEVWEKAFWLSVELRMQGVYSKCGPDLLDVESIKADAEAILRAYSDGVKKIPPPLPDDPKELK